MLPSEFIEQGWTQHALALDVDGMAVLKRMTLQVKLCLSRHVLVDSLR